MTKINCKSKILVQVQQMRLYRSNKKELIFHKKQLY